MLSQTVRPFLAPDVPSPIIQMLPIDILGNGRPDILACHLSIVPAPKSKVPCRVFRPQLDGSLVEVTTQVFGAGPLPSLEQPHEIHVADFNGDGRPDIYVAATGYDAPPFAGEVGLLLLSNGDGTYADRSSTLPQRPAFSHGSCMGDLNGDGRPDIFLSNYPTSGALEKTPYILLGGPNGTFTYSTAGIPAAIMGGTDEVYASCKVADMDGDGHVDLVLGASNAPGNGSIYYNDGAGNFAVRPRTGIPLGPHGENRLVLDFQAIDVNRDGLLDLLVLSSKGFPDEGCAIQVLVNQGAGSFRDETAARMPGAFRTTGPSCYNLRAADFNGDGWPDFYFDFLLDGRLPRFWISRGDGTWQPTGEGPMPAGLTVYVVHTDFDGDGRPDIVDISTDGQGLTRYKPFHNVTPRSAAVAPNRTALWWNPNEPGWGVNVNHQGNTVFATLFVYDAAREPLWLVMPAGTLQADGFSFKGDLYRTSGPPFDAVPFNPIGPADITRVGSMTLAFAAPDEATLRYMVNGITVVKSIRRQVYGSRAADCAATLASRATLANYQDLWWDAAESGWGLNITHQDNTLFATLFTYDAARRGVWFVMSAGQRQADGSYLGDLYRTRGSPFDAPIFSPIGSADVTTVGTMRLRFSSGENGTLVYSNGGSMVTKAITRQVFGSPVPGCS